MARKKPLLSEKDKQIGSAFSHAKTRARAQNVPFDITLDYLRKIAGDVCPVLGTVFDWGVSGLGSGKFKPNGPQLDRIIPELGYVYNNVAFISHRANRIKDNGTMEEHYAIADWIWEQTHVKTPPTASVSERYYHEVLEDIKFGTILATRFGKDGHGTDDYFRTIFGEDIDYSAEESGGDSMGSGSKEVGTLTEADYFKDLRNASETLISLTNRIGYLYRKFRECRMVNGTESELPESCDRRVQQIQRLSNQAIQSLKKTSKDLYSEVDPNWNSDSTGDR